MDDYKVIASMKRHGGGFVQALAYAWERADPENQAKIKATWPEYWARYAKIEASKGTQSVIGGGHGNDTPDARTDLGDQIDDYQPPEVDYGVS